MLEADVQKGESGYESVPGHDFVSTGWASDVMVPDPFLHDMANLSDLVQRTSQLAFENLGDGDSSGDGTALSLDHQATVI